MTEGELVTLDEACQMGVLKCSKDAARKRSQRVKPIKPVRPPR